MTEARQTGREQNGFHRFMMGAESLENTSGFLIQPFNHTAGSEAEYKVNNVQRVSACLRAPFFHVHFVYSRFHTVTELIALKRRGEQK